MPKRKTTLQEECDSLLRRCARLAPTRQKHLRVYVTSLMERFGAIDYALFAVNRLKDPIISKDPSISILDNVIGTTEPAGDDDQRRDCDLAFEQKRHFYLNSFWAFSFSALDILANIINMVYHAVKGERNVSFARLADGYRSKRFRGQETIPATILAKLEETTKRFYFKRLERFRHCCLHRRAVCLRDNTTTDSTAYDYFASASDCRRTTWICDVPDQLPPRFNKNKLLEEECQAIRKGIEEDVITILGLLGG